MMIENANSQNFIPILFAALGYASVENNYMLEFT